MKIHLRALIFITCILLTACGASATATEEAALSNVYTAAASTISAEMSAATSTATPTLFVTPTLFTFPTTVLLSPTSQSIVSYSSSSSSVSTANGCNNSIYISDVTITDGTILAPGESFVKTWEFQNTGTCDWSEEYLLTFVSGNDMDGETAEIGEEVSAGVTGDLSVSLIAPSTEGTYTGYWRLADEDGNLFGQSIYVMIVVSNDAATTTPTPTSTDETEVTSTSVPTSTSTPTIVPTAVPTETAVPTAIPTSTSTETSS